jgi:signal transduction histidine kinase
MRIPTTCRRSTPIPGCSNGSGQPDQQRAAVQPAGKPAAADRERARGRVELRVVDHGPGIPESDWEEVFLPFQRLGDRDNTTGVGLGLAWRVA